MSNAALHTIMLQIVSRTSQLDHIPHFVTESALFCARLLERPVFKDEPQLDAVVKTITPLLTRRHVVYKQLLACIHLPLSHLVDAIDATDATTLTSDERETAITFRDGLCVLYHAV